MSSLATIRAAVRIDLHDEDATAYRWTDATLNRHIQRALREYSHYSPLEQKQSLTTTPNSRDINISALTPRIRIVATEWPTGEYPPNYVPFIEWGDTLTLDVESAPSGAENVNVLWHKEHSINGSVTFPSSHDDIIAAGAAAYAALEWSSFATNRLNVGGDDVWGKYLQWGRERLHEFHRMLRQLPATNRLHTGRLYSGQDARLRSQSTDPGPL